MDLIVKLLIKGKKLEITNENTRSQILIINLIKSLLRKSRF